LEPALCISLPSIIHKLKHAMQTLTLHYLHHHPKSALRNHFIKSPVNKHTRQNIMPPPLQFMRPTNRIKRLLTRSQTPAKSVSISTSPSPITLIPINLIPSILHPPKPERNERNVQMISIIQTKPTPGTLQLFRSQSFQGSLRRDGHEHGKIDGSMR
jgi:hypothetical protein